MTEYYAKVSQGILDEIPRFFCSLPAILAELFANAYRAGASEVHVTYDSSFNMLDIDDNGRGLADPQLLLTAGASGWSDSVIDPAGMGAFSTLRAEIVEKVIYYNHGENTWKMEVTPDVLKGAPAYASPWRDAIPNGMKVTLVLRPEQKITAQQILVARARYPYKVIFHITGDTISDQEIAPNISWEPVLAVDTPVGRAEWNGASSLHSHAVVWEFREFDSHSLYEALSQAVSTSKRKEFLELVINRGAIRWIVNPDSGVKPKLPDRTDLLNDAHLTNAAAVIVQELGDAIINALAQEAQNWPDKIALSAPIYSGDHRVLKGDVVGSLNDYPDHDQKIVFEALGWFVTVWSDLREFWAYDGGEEDGITIECGTTWNVYRTSPLRVNNHAVALTLNNLGTPAIYDPDGVPVIIEGLQVSEKSPWVARADKILVGDIELPYLLNIDDEWGIKEIEDTGLVVICAGNARECIKALRAGDSLIPAAIALVCFNEDWDWEWWDETRCEVDFYAIENDVEVEILDAFRPDVVGDRIAVLRLEKDKREIHATCSKLHKIIDGQPQTGDDVQHITNAINHLQRALEILDARDQEISQRIAVAG